MVGLPARGKSTLARRIKSGLEQQGIHTEIFNNGDTRRKIYGSASASADFFNPYDQSAVSKREEIARMTMESARYYLSLKGDVAIIDATNGTPKQRQTLLECLNDNPVLFIECISGSPDLMDMFLMEKTKLDEFKGMSKESAKIEFQKRIAYYESVYTPLDGKEYYWLRVDAADCRILAENPSSSMPYFPAVRSIVMSRWVNNLYLARHGVTLHNQEGRIGGDSSLGHRMVQENPRHRTLLQQESVHWKPHSHSLLHVLQRFYIQSMNLTNLTLGYVKT